MATVVGEECQVVLRVALGCYIPLEVPSQRQEVIVACLRLSVYLTE